MPTSTIHSRNEIIRSVQCIKFGVSKRIRQHMNLASMDVLRYRKTPLAKIGRVHHVVPTVQGNLRRAMEANCSKYRRIVPSISSLYRYKRIYFQRLKQYVRTLGRTCATRPSSAVSRQRTVELSTSQHGEDISY
jgi:hypothetical protein